MRRRLKVALIELYCRGYLPACVVAFAFKRFKLASL